MSQSQEPLSEKPSEFPSAPEDKSQRNWAMFTHLSALTAFVGIPFGNILGPLIIWLIKKDEMPLVAEEGRAALNFQISMTIYSMVAFFLCFVFIGFILIFPLIIANVVLIILATVKTSNGKKFVYPFTFEFIK